MHSIANDYQIQIMHVVTFFIIFEVGMNILFIVKVRILRVIKWSYKSPKYVDY